MDALSPPVALVLTPAPAPQEAPVPATSDLVLSRRHFKRLRHFFQCRSYGSAAHGDSIDLALVGHGYIARIESLLGSTNFKITPAGEQALAVELSREIQRRSPHHDLASRLANWRRRSGRVTWENIELVVNLPAGGRAVVRPDVFSLVSTYDEKRIYPCVDEVKVSRADFLADVAKPEKRAGYAAVSDALYYVAPAGLIQPAEVPEGCGLIVEHAADQFEILRRAKRKRVALSVHTFMNLILKPGDVTPL
ncbi:hypothetical protein [Cupriavidus pampae]|uniref:Uncharacterized protein n=1 Tax=Cupriavidus pampae TaxID=659251 RepID=A0ABN7ZHU5_9BURK|nr:hypothetical protein [Cupriavidus pampae]CAG9183787.1 hypothetical protein LMG32289_05420 [Cupriavidus pampae]